MATRRQPAPVWTPTAQNSINGDTVVTWSHPVFGTRVLSDGIHPDEQPLSDPAPLQHYDEPEIEETAVDRIATMLQTAGASERAEVKVYRVIDGSLEYCASYQPQQFEEGNFDMLREKFGSGEFELRLYATLPDSKRFVVRSKTRLKIADIRAIEGASINTGGMGQMFEMLAQGQKQMMDALVSIKQAPQKDPMEEMTKMLTMMTMMREAMGINNAPSQKSSIGEIVSAMKELRAVSEEFSPPEKEEPSLMGMLPKVLDLVSGAQQNQQPQPQQFPGVMMPQSFNVPASASPQPQPQPTNEEPNNVNALTLIKMRGYLKSLLMMAERGDEIETGAVYVNEHLPDDLIDIMELPNWFELLSAVESDVAPHKDWLSAVRDRAIAMFDEPDSDHANS